jgi:hypothetical protein
VLFAILVFLEVLLLRGRFYNGSSCDQALRRSGGVVKVTMADEPQSDAMQHILTPYSFGWNEITGANDSDLETQCSENYHY